MAITTNAVASVSHVPRVLIQRLREELAVYAVNTTGASTVTAAGIDKLDQCDGILKEFQAREEAIQADANLSDQGKRTKMEATAKEFFAKLRFVSEAAENRRQAAAELRKELEALPKAPDDPIIEWMRGAEIRGHLRTIDQAARMQLLTDSMKRKELSVLRALESDPMGPSTLVPEEFLGRIKEHRLEKNQAAELTRWKALVFVADKLLLLANVLETTLGKYRLDVPAFPGRSTRTSDLGLRDTTQAPAKNQASDRTPEEMPTFQ